MANRTQEEIVGYIAGGLGLPEPRQESDSNTLGALNSYLLEQPTGPIQKGMKAAVVAGVVDVIMIGRSTKADWVRAKETQMRLVKRALRDGHDDFAVFLQNSLGEIDVRRDEWLPAAGSWRRVRNGTLSPQAIGNWILGFYDDDLMDDVLGQPR